MFPPRQSLLCSFLQMAPYSTEQPKRVGVQHAHFQGAGGRVERSTLALASMDGVSVRDVVAPNPPPAMVAWQRRGSS